MILTRRQFILGSASALASSALPFDIFGLSQAHAAPKLRPNHPITRVSLAELQKMRIAVYPQGIKRSREIYALFNGLKKHGLKASLTDNQTFEDFDMYVTSGWWPPGVLKHAQDNNKNILVLEGGFIQPRDKWLSLGFNGLNGYATFAPAPDNGERFNKYFGQQLQPWRGHNGGYALIIGQVPGDRSLHGTNINRWSQKMANQLGKSRIQVVYRPHPRVRKKAEKAGKKLFVPNGARLSAGTLQQDLAGAAYTVIYSSTTAVESVLAGVPAVVMSPCSVAWPVTSHNLSSPFQKPDRTKWCADLAWRQWTSKELSDGTAWDHTRQVILA